MTVEIRELIVHVEVTEPAVSSSSSPLTEHHEWVDQRLVEMVKQEIMEHLLDRGLQ